MKDKIIQRVLLTFALALIVLVIVAVAAIRNISRAMATSDWVNHTHAVITEVDAIRSSLQSADGAVRTFSLTGDPRDKAASRAAFSAMSEHFEVAKALQRGDAAQAPKLTQLQVLLNQRTEFARRVVEAREANKPEEIRRLFIEDAGGETLREVDRLVEKMKDEQKKLLTERDRASYAQAQTTQWTVLGGVAINFVLLAGAAWLVRDDIAARRRAAAVLAEANATLEAKVKERTAELAATNERLVAENQERQWGAQALEHQLRYSQLIINSISDLIFVTTKALNVSRINPAVTQRTGRQSTELVNGPLSRVVTLARPGPSAFDPLAQALKEGRELQDEPAMVTSKDGRTVPARLSLIPLRDRDKVVGSVVTVHLAPDPH
jgi:PAS domain S-box-containing protein